MKLSWRWLSELVDLAGVTPEEGARRLSLHVADVEGLERLGGGLDAVVSARVESVEPHPNAERLRLCTVSYGGAVPLRVVCGAPNVAVGQIVCFAPVGTTLPNGVTLKKAKIRGVESEGMICAEDEMGIGTAHDGIVVLPEGTPVGRPVAEALGLSDTLLDVNNTGITNRPDLWGHVGFARELAAIFGRSLRPRSTSKAEAALAKAGGAPFPVAIEDAAACRRYVGLVVEGVTNGPAPASLVKRLESLGLRSVDLIVDLTNLVMLEQGQPLHAFDLRDIGGGKIVVRRAAAGERIITLDGVGRGLDPEDLVIADAQRPLALAGVMGGEGSGVRPDTTAILLESASFDAARIRKSATRHGLRTDASARFEKSLDPVGAWTAALRFLELLLEHVPSAKCALFASDVFPRPIPPVTIDLPYDLVRRRLGLPDGAMDNAEIVARLESVGFSCRPTRGGTAVSVPSWRATKDVSIPEDLVEEVGRLHGYADIPARAPLGVLRPVEPPVTRRIERDGRSILSLDLGYSEIASYYFTNEKECARIGVPADAGLRLTHPLSAEQDRLQVTCTQNLLRAALRNQPQFASIRICEWTRIFLKHDREHPEMRVVGLLRAERDTASDPKGEVFLSLKDDVVRLLARLGVGPLAVEDASESRIANAAPPAAWLHPGRQAVVTSQIAGGHDARVVAVVGELQPSVARAWGLKGIVAVGEVNLERAKDAMGASVAYHPVPRFPVVPFDVAVVVPRKTPAAAVEKILMGAAPEAVRDVALFDVYEGKGVPDGHRSLAFTMAFVDEGGTLAPKAIESLRARVLKALANAGWSVRSADAGR